jgi:chemotaxis protein MotB
MLVDQDGRSMFREGSKYPYETTRRLREDGAGARPNAEPDRNHRAHDLGQQPVDPSYTGWDLSTERANVARQILSEYGVPDDQFYSVVVGKADTEPLFPNDPYLAANRRIGILLMAEEPPIPPGHKPLGASGAI